MNNRLELRVVRGESISDADRTRILDLCNRAYEEDMATLFATFVGATHVLGSLDGAPVSHALWVTRYLQVGAEPLLRTAYIEAVATEPAFQKRGFATAVMQRAAAEIKDYDLAALSPFSVAYYTRLGWELWRGPLFIRTENGPVPTPDEEVMILRLPGTPALDLDAPLSAEWRAGEVW